MLKKLVFKIFLLIMPFIILISYLNYNVDSNFIFHSDSEEVYVDIAQKLVSGTSVYIPDNYENRNLQEELYREVDNINIVVLGTSRGRDINQSLVKEKLINSCVSAGTLEDVVVFSGMIFNLNVNPKKVIIETSPYFFNNKITESRWQMNEDYYDYMINCLSDSSSNRFFNDYKYELLKELLSVEYFKINLGKKESNFEMESTIETVNYVLDDVITVNYEKVEHSFITPDGVMTFKNYVDGLNNTEDKIKFGTYRENSFRKGYKALSVDKQDIFESLITYYLERGIEVEFFLAPYAPYAYDYFIEEYPPYEETEKYIRDFAKNNSIKVIGSYSPHKYELYDRWDFYDYAHPSRRTVEMIFQEEYSD